jgi:hypothetical protein
MRDSHRRCYSKVLLTKHRVFNTGSPWNVPAGHGARNMDQLVAHYEKKNADEEERKAKLLAEKR